MFPLLTMILLLANLAASGILLHRMPKATPKAEAPAPVSAVRQEKDPVDEGFENIMRFSVNGQTGFESRRFEE